MLVQLHVRTPVDVRRLYRRRHPMAAKTLGTFASVAVRLDGLGGDQLASPLDVRRCRIATEREAHERARRDDVSLAQHALSFDRRSGRRLFKNSDQCIQFAREIAKLRRRQ